MPPRKRKAAAVQVKVEAGPSGKKAKKADEPIIPDVKKALVEASKKEVKKKAKPDKLFPHLSCEVFDDYDCMLNQTNIGHNNNKYYIIQVLKQNGAEMYYAWNRWGRVGENGSNKVNGPFKTSEGAVKIFCQKFKDKTKNDWDNRDEFKPVSGKYTMIEMSYEDDDDDETTVDLMKVEVGSAVSKRVKPSRLDAETQKLLALIFDGDMFKDQMMKYDIDVKKMPLGKLSKAQIAKGYECLEEIEAVLTKTKKGNITELSSKFYTLIPHDFKRMRPPPINDKELLQKKYDMMAVLGDIEIAQGMQKQKIKSLTDTDDAAPNPLDINYELLSCDLTYIDHKSKEFQVIQTFFENTRTSYRPKACLHAWVVNRQQEGVNFMIHDGIGNRKLLWHGTKLAVVAAILKSGLRIMPHSGGRVGKGIYFASENSKSAAYVGTSAEYLGVMFLNEVVLGTEHHIFQDDPSLTAPPSGKHSVVARGRTEPDHTLDTTLTIDGKSVVVPQGKPKPTGIPLTSFDQSEYLIYKENQCRIRYLCLCKF